MRPGAGSCISVITVPALALLLTGTRPGVLLYTGDGLVIYFLISIEDPEASTYLQV